MADVTRTIHVDVLTFDPAQGRTIPVPNARVLIEDSGWLWDPDLSDGTHTTDASGRAAVEITFDDAEEANLNPYLTVTIPAEADRTVPGGAPADRQFELPEEWETHHHENRRIPNITDHTNPNTPLTIFVGLKARLRVSYTDFEASGHRNPIALPEKTARIYLADHDYFLFDWFIFDWLDPDDTLKGVGFDGATNAIISVGDEDQYPYRDEWPTAPSALLEAPAAPRAWIDPPGAPVGVLGGGSFAAVGPVAVSPDGFVFMIDGTGIHRFYPDGTLAETLEPPTPGITTPAGLAVDQYGHLFIADAGRDEIVIYRPGWYNGTGNRYEFVARRGNFNLLPPLSGFLFDDPHGLAVVPNRVVDGEEMLVVANTGNDEVALLHIEVSGTAGRSHRASNALTVDLSFGGTFGSQGTNADQFEEPIDVAADRTGRVFVADRTLHRVSRWQLDAARTAGTHEDTWEVGGGAPGPGNGAFNTPEAIAVDATQGMVYVAESGNQRIQRLNADTGATQVSWQPLVGGTPATPGGVAVDARGDAFVADTAHQRVHRGTLFDEDGSLRAEATEPRALGALWTPATDAAHMQSPAYVLFDDEGRLWVSDTGNDRVLAFVRDGDGVLAHDDALTTGLTGLDAPRGLALGPDGDLFVVDAGNHRIRRYTGSPLAHTADLGTGVAGSGNDQLDEPRGLVIVQRTVPTLYVADRDNDRIQVLERDGTHVATLAAPGGSFDAPEDVAADSQGNLFVADTGNSRIVQYDAEHTVVREFPVPAPLGGTPAPAGLSVDDEDKLIITDRDAGHVLRVEADGTLLAYWNLSNLLRQDVANSELYFPELARQILFDTPTRAAVDARGLMAVADTGHDRVRLVRIHTAIEVNLFDLGEGRPDIIFHAKTKANWRDEIGLELKVGDVSIFDETHDFETEPVDNFAGDVFEHTQVLGPARHTNAAINVMRVVRQAQTWFQQLTRTDEADHRWGTPDTDRSLGVDLISGDGSFQFIDVNMGMDDHSGRGADAWDDDLLIHEMTHWVFYKAIHPYPPFTLVGLIGLGASHRRSQLTNENLAISEGWAQYTRLFWGYEYGRSNRLRGFALWPSGGEVAGLSDSGNAPYHYLYGGPETAGLPAFDAPEQALRNEGYIANMLYQLHLALADPAFAFADAPSYWNGFNARYADDQCQRFADTIWRALRMFPADPPTNELDRGSMIYLRNVLEAAHTHQADLVPVVQALFELNNLLMPRLTILDGTTALGDEVSVDEGVAKVLTLRLRDATDRPLAGYNLHIEVTSGAAGHYSLPGGPGPTVRHGLPAPSAPPAGNLYRATTVGGEVALTVTAGPGTSGTTETLVVTYQPDFDTDETFAPPAAGQDRETTLRQHYLYQLRSAGKTWDGTDNNVGARIRKTLTLQIQ